MTATDHRILALALTNYQQTDEATATIELTPETRESIRALRRHNYLRTNDVVQNKPVTITLTLKGLAASLTLPTLPTGPLPKRLRVAEQRRRDRLDDRVLMHLLTTPTIPKDSGDVEEALGNEASAHAYGNSLVRLTERGLIEVAIEPQPGTYETAMYVPTLQTVQNYLHAKYPKRADYETAKQRLVGRAFSVDMLDDEPITETEAHELDKTFTRDARAAMLQLWTAHEQGIEAIPTSVEADYAALEVLEAHKLAAPAGDGLWRITLGGLTYARNRWGKHQKAA